MLEEMDDDASASHSHPHRVLRGSFLKLEISVQETVGELKKILAHDDEYLRKDVYGQIHMVIFTLLQRKVLNDDERTLGDCGLEDESCVMAAVSLPPSMSYKGRYVGRRRK